MSRSILLFVNKFPACNVPVRFVNFPTNATRKQTRHSRVHKGQRIAQKARTGLRCLQSIPGRTPNMEQRTLTNFPILKIPITHSTAIGFRTFSAQTVTRKARKRFSQMQNCIHECHELTIKTKTRIASDCMPTSLRPLMPNARWLLLLARRKWVISEEREPAAEASDVAAPKCCEDATNCSHGDRWR